MKTLTFSTLFPNAAQPTHGVFVANRLSHLLRTGAVSTEIVAPVPWFPSKNPRFEHYARYAAAPKFERFGDTPVFHPRYPVIPRIGMNLAPGLLYFAARRAVASILQAGFSFDLIDAHYFYPDGVAAVLLGRKFGKPVVITARGSDINEIADYAVPRRMILWAAREAAGIITVCQALKDRLVEIGANGRDIRVLRNGVDLQVFRPANRDDARAKHGLAGQVLLSVGHLIPRKAHHLVIEALASLPGMTLLIAGDGPEKSALNELCRKLGVGERVRFLGQVPHAGLAELYSAADVLVLASSREGWANVLLEAMACGTSVVASNVWGAPEVVTEPAAGLLVADRTGPAFAAAIAQLLSNPPSRAATRSYAERFSWDATTQGQLDLFESILARRTLERQGSDVRDVRQTRSSATRSPRGVPPG
jgi:glycosyltransferase involved in cell wall biosynthesis